MTPRSLRLSLRLTQGLPPLGDVTGDFFVIVASWLSAAVDAALVIPPPEGAPPRVPQDIQRRRQLALRALDSFLDRLFGCGPASGAAAAAPLIGNAAALQWEVRKVAVSLTPPGGNDTEASAAEAELLEVVCGALARVRGQPPRAARAAADALRGLLFEVGFYGHDADLLTERLTQEVREGVREPPATPGQELSVKRACTQALEAARGRRATAWAGLLTEARERASEVAAAPPPAEISPPAALKKFLNSARCGAQASADKAAMHRLSAHVQQSADRGAMAEVEPLIRAEFLRLCAEEGARGSRGRAAPMALALLQAWEASLGLPRIAQAADSVPAWVRSLFVAGAFAPPGVNLAALGAAAGNPLAECFALLEWAEREERTVAALERLVLESSAVPDGDDDLLLGARALSSGSVGDDHPGGVVGRGFEERNWDVSALWDW